MHENDSVPKKCAKISIYLILSILPWFIIFAVANAIETSRKKSTEIKVINYKPTHNKKSVVDHSRFKELQKEFSKPEEVTETCVSCHNTRYHEIMANAHWTWSRLSVRANGDSVQMGKVNIINNFCTATTPNRWKCTSCHIGYGWHDVDFDFSDYKKVDCIVCHDKTGAYEKEPLGSGYPVSEKKPYADKTYFPPNYNYIAKNVGSPDIENCGKCHFFGGGGDNVKHGDLSSDLYHADRNMDVHMDENGNNMTCINCHQTENHQMLGKLYSVSTDNTNRMNCEHCHEGNVHRNNNLNRHMNKIACQTCHIPTYAKGVPTKMLWDWSTTGKLDASGKKIRKKDSLGNIIYKSEKGTFEWAKNVSPEYVWFNGSADQYIHGDKIEDTTKVLQMIQLFGSYNDPNSKIIPVKIHKGKQPYDTKLMTLIAPYVYGHDSTAFQESMNWDLSAEKGMKDAGLTYSGSYDFINTEAAWPINHMVAPAEDALKCIECHSKEGRLKNLAGFYMPGRDRSIILDFIGMILIIGAFGGVIIHAVFRFLKNKHIIN